MKKLCVILCSFLFIGGNLQAQCPPSSEPGIHIVQQDENLFRISMMYDISLKRLLALNNMQETDLLPACKKLRIGENKVQPATERATPSRSTNNGWANATTTISTSLSGQRQAGNKHIVQSGETVAGLASLYGYTEARFREINAMGNERLTAGSIVLSNDCACNRVMYAEDARPEELRAGTDLVTTDYKPTTTTFYKETKPTRIKKHEAIAPSELGKTVTGSSPGKTLVSSPEADKVSPPSASAPYMTSVEMDMLNEINLMRGNPPAYIKYVDEYVADQKAKGDFGFPIDITVVDELKDELRKLAPLSQLQPKECVYTAAKKHGEDIMKMGHTDHIGSDGKWPWDRVRRECPDLNDGNENLVGGPDNVRESVVILLIDEGIPNRGHRKTLLRSDWVYSACYKIGKVGMMPHCWVQKFGF